MAFKTAARSGWGWQAALAASALLLAVIAVFLVSGTGLQSSMASHRTRDALLSFSPLPSSGGGNASAGGKPAQPSLAQRAAALFAWQQQQQPSEGELDVATEHRLEDVPLINADSNYTLEMGDYDMPLPVRPLRDFLTLLIPTTGRATLHRTLDSLINQTMPRSWRALVLVDGPPRYGAVTPSPLLDDPRVRVFFMEKQLYRGPVLDNNAGGLRNLGIKIARTPWVAMVDDDDTLHPRYVERLLYETQQHPEAELVDFRMFLNDYVEPGNGTRGAFIGMGISFAMRRATCLNGYFFVPDWKEDGELLLFYQESRRPFLISPFVNYYVKASPWRPEKHDVKWRTLNRFLVK